MKKQTRGHTRLNFVRESSTFCRNYHYGMIPEVNFTRCHHFCSIVSDTTLTCSNCGVFGVKFDPCECCQLLPYAYTMLCEINLRGETRSFCIIWLNVSDITFKRTNSFLRTTNFSICRLELRCEEDEISKAEVESSAGGCARRTRVRNPFRRLWLSGLSPSQRRDNSQSSLGVCAATRVHMILFYK